MNELKGSIMMDQAWEECGDCDGVGYVSTSACGDCNCTGGPETMACMSPCKTCAAHFKTLDEAYGAATLWREEANHWAKLVTNLLKAAGVTRYNLDQGDTKNARGIIDAAIIAAGGPSALRPSEEDRMDWVGRLGVCELGRVGYITNRKQLPWGLAWIGIGLDGKEWSSRNPTVPTEIKMKAAIYGLMEGEIDDDM